MNWDKSWLTAKERRTGLRVRIRSSEFRHLSSYLSNQPCGLFHLQKAEGDVTPLIGSAVLTSTRNCETTAADHIDICPNKAVQDCVGLAHRFLKSGALIVLFFDQFMVLQEGGTH
jgi:hypothetical protein